MVKKKISGQTLTIIILSSLLLITIVFGGVYAFHTARSNKISGKIVMANLKISLDVESSSDKSEIVITKEEHFVPGQYVDNYPLKVKNLSTVDVCLIVVYRVNAEKETKEGKVSVEDKFDEPLMSFGVDYYNPSKNKSYVFDSSRKEWIDFVFVGENKDTGAIEKYRCLVLTKSTKEYGSDLTVIGENNLMLSNKMDGDYMSATISLTFQAYAIAANSFEGELTDDATIVERSQLIVSKIYESQSYKFLDLNTKSA